MNEDRDESQGNITESESIAAEVPADEGVVTDNEFAADEEILMVRAQNLSRTPAPT